MPSLCVEKWQQKQLWQVRYTVSIEEERIPPGAVIQEGVSALEVLLGHDKQVYAVDTTEGLIETPVFVDASGIVRRLLYQSYDGVLQWSGTCGVRTLPHGRLQLASASVIYQHILMGRLNSAAVSSRSLPS